RSSQVHRASLSQCLRPCWRTQRAFAQRTSATCFCTKTRCFVGLRCITRRRLWLTLTNVTKSYLAAPRLFLIVLPTQRRQSISSILLRNIQASQSSNSRVLELFCWFQCSRKES